jgi:hypothetical protein
MGYQITEPLIVFYEAVMRRERTRLERGDTMVADPLRRGQIEIDVVVFAPDDPGLPRRVLSLGEVKWDKVMTLGHLERLRRARDLLAVKGYDTTATRLTCYSGAGFDPDLGQPAQRDARVQLFGLDELYG